jgi:uncharacterized protein YdeI (YjbR/CyaY-like superfamily)
MNPELYIEILSFDSSIECYRWFAKRHCSSHGVWLRFFKKDSGVTSVMYNEVLDEALCNNWIDGQLKLYNEKSWLRKFTPLAKWNNLHD